MSTITYRLQFHVNGEPANCYYRRKTARGGYETERHVATTGPERSTAWRTREGAERWLAKHPHLREVRVWSDVQGWRVVEVVEADA